MRSTIVAHWTIEIEDTGTQWNASITNVETGNSLIIPSIQYDPNEPGARDEACADLFAGPMPCIRDSFDQV